MRRRSLAFLTALALALAPTAPAATQAAVAAAKPAGFTLPLNLTADGVAFTGTLRVQRFAVGGATLVASGLLTGTLVDQAGKVSAVVRNVSLPVTQGTPGPGTPPPTTPPPPPPTDPPPTEPPEPNPLDADFGGAAGDSPPVTAPPVSCPALHLELGPLELDLLGTALRLDRVVLDLEAMPGASVSMRNSLCALTSGGGMGTMPLEQAARVLNRILRVLS